ELAHGIAVVAPVAVRALVDDPALLEQAAQHELDLERSLAHPAHADREVLVVDEDGDQRLAVGLPFSRHVRGRGRGRRVRSPRDRRRWPRTARRTLLRAWR